MTPEWDESAIQTSRCDVARASAVPAGVQLDFGASVQGEGSSAVQVRLLRRILLDPDAARALAQLLARLIAEQSSG